MKKILLKTCVDYAPSPNKAIWYQTDELPNEELISSCFGIIKLKDKCVLIKHITRGIEIPGGHKELGESALDCFFREIREETGIQNLVDVHLLAYQKLKVLAPKPVEYKYPYPVSYLCFFVAEALDEGYFTPNLDSEAVLFLSKEELIQSMLYSKYSFIFDLL